MMSEESSLQRVKASGRTYKGVREVSLYLLMYLADGLPEWVLLSGEYLNYVKYF